MVKSASEGETRTRARTRRAILDAAVQVLGDNPAAPLSQVARVAGVARSTLQRYFAERSDLTEALRDYADELTNEACERARTTEGTAIEAFARIVAEYFTLRKVILMTIGSDGLTASAADRKECGPADLALQDLIARGHADGTIDPEITPLWAEQLLWAGLYAGWTYVTTARASAYEALTLCLHSLVKAVERRPGKDS